MRVPLSWLGEMVELRGSAEDVCAALTGAGIETEVVDDARPRWDGVITVRLLSVERHPDADHLTICRPTDGVREWPVVCGAPNHKAGDVCALATVGTVLPGDVRIKRSKIRGEVSEGMLCSERELGISEEARGIMILPPDTELGVPLSSVVSAGDVVVEAAAQANRGDCLSVIGLARELSAVTGWPLRARPAAAESRTDMSALDTLTMPAPAGGADDAVAGAGEDCVRVEIRASDGCPRYAGAVMAGVRIAPSPKWMQDRLQAAGLRPINNVVDCTNYAMLELGNPLHAFDRRFLRGDVVVARWAGEGERARTLDGGEHVLRADDLVIADAQGVIALAGVMGGENSEVREDSRVLFLESAHFDAASVRRTAHRHRLGTEASYRFARGVDPELPCAALLRLIELLERTSGARLLGQVVDLHPNPRRRARVNLRPSRIPGLLGMDIPRPRLLELLRRDGLDVVSEGPDRLVVEAPSYRFDVEREVDVLEEVARLQGFDSIPERPLCRPLLAVPRQPEGLDVASVRRALVQAGLSEAIHFSFIDPSWLEALSLPEDHPLRAGAVRVANPLSFVGGVLRTMLLPSLLRTAGRNLAMGAEDVRLFELRHTFASRGDGLAEILAGAGDRPLDRPPAIERLCAGGVLVGRRSPPGWSGDAERIDLFDVRGCVEAIERAVHWKGWEWRSSDLPPFLDQREGAVLHASQGQATAGWFGRLAAPVLRAHEIDSVVFAFEIDLDALAPRKPVVPAFQPFSRFPMVQRDLAFVAPDEVTAGALLDAAARAARKGSKDAFLGVHVFDVYRGKGIPEGRRSLALRFRFRAPDRTLEDREVDGAMAQVQSRLAQQFGVELRA